MGRCTLDTPVIPSRAGSMNTIVTSDPIYQRSHGGTQQQCRSLSCLTTTFWSRNIGTGTSSKGKWQRLSSTLTTWRGRMENPWAGCGSLLLTPWRKTPSGTMHSHLGALKKKATFSLPTSYMQGPWEWPSFLTVAFPSSNSIVALQRPFSYALIPLAWTGLFPPPLLWTLPI